jgi:outer membrane receptor protein involved in Fe transport
MRILSAALLAALAMAASAMGQSFYGSIVGNVTDSTAASVSGATVTLINNGTNERKTAQTSADGSYQFLNLNPGSYRLETEMQGFKREGRNNLELEVGAALRIDVTLQVGDATQTVEVSAAAPLIQTENATLSQVVAGRTVQEMPLNGRNVLNLVALVPGVVPQGSAMGNLTGKNIFSAGNFQIGGGAANQGATYLDGASVNVNYGNLTTLVPTQDAISEFRVQTSNNTAEFGRYAGGVINLSSKSGTNEIHATAYEYFRNRVLNAGNFFSNAQGLGKPAYVQNQFGVAGGGPIRKDKTFFYGTYEGYRQRAGTNLTNTVPSAAIIGGDFSGYKNAAGAVIPIYDPASLCRVTATNTCPTTGPVRMQFAGNIIPASRFDKVANNLRTQLFAAPNAPGVANTQQYNFLANLATGGDNDQVNFRVDHNLSDKQRIFGRFTRWALTNLPSDAYPQTPYYAGGTNPETFVTKQIVAGDSYAFTPTLFGDFRAAFLRFVYDRLPKTVPGTIDPTTIGFPAYMKQNALATYPSITFTEYNPGTGGQRIYSRNNSYSLSANLTKVAGRHQIKFGSELRRVDFNFFQVNGPGGTYAFSNLFTSQNALAAGATGNSFASFLLGYTNTGTQLIPNFTASQLRYEGFFVNDTWQFSGKLTVNLGLRYEIPGQWTERNDNMAVFDQTATSPLAAATGLPLKGAFVAVNTPGAPGRGLKAENYKAWQPRLGIAYRLDNKTVFRAGVGIFYLPSDSTFTESPYQNAVNLYSNTMITTQDASQTAVNLLADPFPTGLVLPPGRSAGFQQALYGANFTAASGGGNTVILRDSKSARTYQWNATIQRQIGETAVEVGYSGARGVHLPNSTLQLNQLPDQYLSLGNALLAQVKNPFFGLITTGPLSTATVPLAQLLRPYPQYQNLVDGGGFVGNSTYNAMTARVERRLGGGGTLLGAYTFSKVMSDVESATPWLESNGTGAIQDFNNRSLDKSLSSFDSNQRLTVSYVFDLPFGRNGKFLVNTNPLVSKVISGWALNGVTTFQKGFPLNLTVTPNNTNSQGGGSRPNVVAGCDKFVDGGIQTRLTRYFNTSCFTIPANFTFGNESRTDPDLRGPGIANYDFALSKRTSITERYTLEFRGEIFNLFNRVQFGMPNRVATSAANSTFGQITTTANDPRLVQLALRLKF